MSEIVRRFDRTFTNRRRTVQYSVVVTPTGCFITRRTAETPSAVEAVRAFTLGQHGTLARCRELAAIEAQRLAKEER